MTKERLYLFDTTLRDGAQTAGVEFSLEDKLAIAALLDGIGIDYVEGGYPGANVVDTAFFESKRVSRAGFVAFGMTKRAGRSVENDPGLQELLGSASDAVCFVSKAWDHQVKLALGISTKENLKSLAESVAAAIAAGKEAHVDCEHFFDGYKANRTYALEFVRTALGAGARWITLCDTNGGTLPSEIGEIVADVMTVAPGDKLGIHAHDDTGNAVANSLAAIEAGVRQIQGTLNGLGERCGNANLVSLIPTLVLKPAYAEKLETGVTRATLGNLTHVSRAFDEILNRAPNRQAPYVGASAFATKAGIHASALAKDPSTYEHVPPESVGNERAVMVSQQAGKSNLLSLLGRAGFDIAKDDPRLDRLLRQIKEREARGYSYDGAEASFVLLAHKALGSLPEYFRVTSYRTTVERRFNARGELVTMSEAVVKLDIEGETYMSVAEGNGPVNALDLAMRKDLGKYSARIDDLELVDFKVRILNGGTGAVTRVLIESRDDTGARWFTVGVSPNIIDASFEALYESFTYKLMKTSAGK
ncbi:citramalate synthase [Pelagibacterium montanilacus]|uniref:citramalate synthase n=1 Tax=Pelagibacterium montanilacus TaxID=2185280 RepID=UPI000F8ED4B6|nr:citramalate synthase [Pelagibacterium montanilacus]